MSFLAGLLGGRGYRTGTSLEDPRVPLSAWKSSNSILGLGRYLTRSGVRVDEQRALTIAAVWRAVNLISRDVGKLPLKVYRREGEGKTPDRKHPAHRLVRRRPNAYMGGFIFRQTLMVSTLLWGNGYAAIDRDEDGQPTAMLPLLPWETYPVRYRGELQYVAGYGTPHERRLDPSMVVHLKGLGFDGLAGKSVIEYAAESLGLSIAARDFGSAHFKNAASPRVILEHPSALSPEAAARLAARFDLIHSGIDNAFRTAVVEEGMKAVPFPISAKDAQLLEMREFGTVEVAQWFNVPPHKVGDRSRTSFKSLEEENQSYLDEGLDPWLVVVEEELEEKLLTEREKERESHAIEFVRQALVRANLAARANFYGSAIIHGYMSRDEVRARENLNPIPGGDGAKFFRPLNVAVVGEEPPEPAPKPTPDPPAPMPDPMMDDDEMMDEEDGRGLPAGSIEAARVVAGDAAGRAIRRIALAAGRAARVPERFLDATMAAALRAEHHEAVRAIFSPACSMAAALTERALDLEAVLDEFFGRLAVELHREAAQARTGDLALAIEDWRGRREAEIVTDLVDRILSEGPNDGA